MLQQQSQQQQQQQQQNELEYENWVPPDRLHAIGSFVTGASYDEINRDIALASARPYPTYAYPYNKRVQHSHTPHLIYSDNESKSVSEEEPTAAVAAATEATRAASVPVPATSTFTPAPSTSDVHPHTAAFSPYTNQPSQPYHSPQAQTLTYSHPHPSPSLYPTPNHHSASQLPSIHRYTYDSNSSSRTAMSPAPPRLSYHLPITYQAGLQSPVYHHAATMTPAPYGNDEPPVGWRSGERTDWYRPRTAA
ncbi:hypothetical protein BDF20DRAFT_843345 [Mycotypha africana]|uniref:uncharacterized protein n=1 Tax=Mycotypha africana TaxID=64632 RepID=UPI002300AE15|nr:uncharacterized protein BDF20DRAFT_843345 [Mycotypha africana]KAI8991210.1 hypothetical protein BDF20DRAFT_843345 [Mycotypha africana]